MKKIAFITGITGQDGSYLAEFLLEKQYKVYGMIRRSSSINTKRIDRIYNDLRLFYGDLTDTSNIVHILATIKEENKEYIEKSEKPVFEIYNLGAQSHVKVSFEMPEFTANIDALGVLRILEAIRICNLTKIVRFYQASTSEMFGLIQSAQQTESTPFYPRSPYAVSKLFGHWMVVNYREAYGMFACSGILFNHETARRGETFVTRKITIGLGKILRGEQECITLGNLDSKRDWSDARDMVKAMWMMLQSDKPVDYVVASGEHRSVRSFVEICFRKRGFILKWSGEGVEEVGIDEKTGRVLVRVSEKYFRPSEVDDLLGDPSRIRNCLGWKPEISFEQMIDDMLEQDCKI